MLKVVCAIPLLYLRLHPQQSSVKCHWPKMFTGSVHVPVLNRVCVRVCVCDIALIWTECHKEAEVLPVLVRSSTWCFTDTQALPGGGLASNNMPHSVAFFIFCRWNFQQPRRKVVEVHIMGGHHRLLGGTGMMWTSPTRLGIRTHCWWWVWMDCHSPQLCLCILLCLGIGRIQRWAHPPIWTDFCHRLYFWYTFTSHCTVHSCMYCLHYILPSQNKAMFYTLCLFLPWVCGT